MPPPLLIFDWGIEPQAGNHLSPEFHLVAPGYHSKAPRPPVTGTPKAGRLKGLISVPADFDEPLEELREYTE